MPRPHSRNKINRKTPHVKRIYEANNPLTHRSRVIVILIGEDAKRDREAELGEDEGEFDPEGDAQDAVLAVVDAETLVFPADEDCRDDVAGAIWDWLVE
jgi:hypothetical protein